MTEETKEQTSDSSLELAYGYVFHSYEWMLRRVEAVESRIQNFLIFAATVTAGVPIAVVSLNGDSAMLNVLVVPNCGFSFHSIRRGCRHKSCRSAAWRNPFSECWELVGVLENDITREVSPYGDRRVWQAS